MVMGIDKRCHNSVVLGLGKHSSRDDPQHCAELEKRIFGFGFVLGVMRF